jgi:hypothetical protein
MLSDDPWYHLQDAHILVLKGHLMHLHMQMTLVQLEQNLKVDWTSYLVHLMRNLHSISASVLANFVKLPILFLNGVTFHFQVMVTITLSNLLSVSVRETAYTMWHLANVLSWRMYFLGKYYPLWTIVLWITKGCYIYLVTASTLSWVSSNSIFHFIYNSRQLVSENRTPVKHVIFSLSHFCRKERSLLFLLHEYNLDVSPTHKKYLSDEICVEFFYLCFSAS